MTWWQQSGIIRRLSDPQNHPDLNGDRESKSQASLRGLARTMMIVVTVITTVVVIEWHIGKDNNHHRQYKMSSTCRHVISREGNILAIRRAASLVCILDSSSRSATSQSPTRWIIVFGQ